MRDMTIPSQGCDVAVFEPEETKKKIAAADAGIEYFQRVKDWPALEVAVDYKLDEITEFVGWWADRVTVNKGRYDREGKKRSTEFFDTEQAEAHTGISQQQVSRWRKRLEKPDAYRAKLFGKAYAEVFGKAENYRVNGDSDDEWYTPAEYIEAARAVMGGIDLDPASNPEANEIVKAEQYFTAHDNGLIQPWQGRVWMNPPYSRDLMPAFIHKLIGEYQAGNVEQAVMVSHNNTDTAWFQAIAAVASAVCFPAKRIRFYRADDVAAPANGQVFVYLGDNDDVFADVFQRYGVIMTGLAPA